LPGTRCRLVDPEDPSLVVPVGSPGELAVAGPQRFLGWYGEEPGDTFTPDGFYLTGDIAVMDEAGFFSIVDRKKEVIVSGGFNIYPLEVEEVLRTHPLVEDACVIGLPDRYRGETVRAAVVLKAGADADEVVAGLTTHCEQRLSTYKIPRAFDVRAELPRTPLGKIQRHVVKDAVKAEASGASVRQDGGS
jgi:long-chain acyl-CoA synthetase